MYIPMIIQGVTCTALMILVWRKLHEQNKKVGADGTAKGAGGIPRHVIRRMEALGIMMGLASAAAAIPRVLQSISGDTYFETRDAGKVGSTEMLASTFGFIVSLAFVYDHTVLDWWKGKSSGAAGEGTTVTTTTSVSSEDV